MAKLTQKVAESFKESAEVLTMALRNGQKQREFFFSKDTMDEILAIFERKDLREKLQELLRKEHTQAEWVTIKVQMEYAAATHRDVKSRYRGRLDNYRAASIQKKLLPMTVEFVDDQVDKISK